MGGENNSMKIMPFGILITFCIELAAAYPSDGLSPEPVWLGVLVQKREEARRLLVLLDLQRVAL